MTHPSDSLPPLGEVIRQYDLGAKKSLGQHFLLDLNLTGRIARAAAPLDTGTTIEIGPGPGGLTRALLSAGATVIAIERDPRCLAALKDVEAAYPGKLEVVEGDAMAIDPRTLGTPPRRIVSNLPYNISAPLLISWLRHASDYESFTLMFQKEVADRLTAQPATKAYGRLSVMAQWLCAIKPVFNVDRKAFTPPPKVVSTVVRLDPYPEPLAPASWNAMEAVVQAAFGQRRKMLRQSLKSFGFDFDALGIDPTARAENLGVEDFARLATAAESSGKI